MSGRVAAFANIRLKEKPGLQCLFVRGPQKVSIEALLPVRTNNIQQWIRLRRS